jgi:hypothetical protein
MSIQIENHEKILLNLILILVFLLGSHSCQPGQKSSETLSGKVFIGKVFIDATYEGDHRVQAYCFRIHPNGTGIHDPGTERSHAGRYGPEMDKGVHEIPYAELRSVLLEDGQVL